MNTRTAEALRIVVVGHVDHGKSTLIGRLLHETGSLADGRLEALRDQSTKRGMPLEWSFLLDSLQAERDQGITIDSTQIRFRTEARDYLIIDAPGHKEFIGNMLTGAAQADAAVLVVDGVAGVEEQTRRHAFLVALLGLERVVVAVNKIDLLDHDADRFAAVARDVEACLAGLGLKADAIVPLSARNGDNLKDRSELTPWYEGPTLLDALDALRPITQATDRPLRFAVQDVYKFDDRRLIAGRIEAGRLKVGDTLTFAPSDKQAKVASIETWASDVPKISAAAGQSIAITLAEPIFVERGAVGAKPKTAPSIGRRLTLRLFWFGKGPLTAGRAFRLRLATQDVDVTVTRLLRGIDIEGVAGVAVDAVAPGAFAEVEIEAAAPVWFDRFATSPETGRIVLIDGHRIVACATVVGVAEVSEAQPAPHLHPVLSRVTAGDRARLTGHGGGVIWLTGLSGSGKTTLAIAAEATLVARGIHAVLLDGDTVRTGLNRDLGFSAADRAENVRRLGEVARLMAQAGQIVLVAAISPARAARNEARRIVGAGFHEVFVDAPLETCAERDPKGLYAKARAQEISDLTGFAKAAPYEAPLEPELTLRTREETAEVSLDRLLNYVDQALGLAGNSHPAPRQEVPA